MRSSIPAPHRSTTPPQSSLRKDRAVALVLAGEASPKPAEKAVGLASPAVQSIRKRVRNERAREDIANLKHLVVPTSITNHKSIKCRFCCHRRTSGLAWTDSQCSCLSVEETDAQSAATAVAGESDQVNSPQFANDHRRFSQTGLLNSLQRPVKPGAPPSHEHSD